MDLFGVALLSASTSLHCIACGVEEYVVPLDDQPLDEDFAAAYLCDECIETGPKPALAGVSGSVTVIEES